MNYESMKPENVSAETGEAYLRLRGWVKRGEAQWAPVEGALCAFPRGVAITRQFREDAMAALFVVKHAPVEFTSILAQLLLAAVVKDHEKNKGPATTALVDMLNLAMRKAASDKDRVTCESCGERFDVDQPGAVIHHGEDSLHFCATCWPEMLADETARDAREARGATDKGDVE
jgi:hypothetical protein